MFDNQYSTIVADSSQLSSVVLGTVFICNGIPFESPVIPAKAGIQFVNGAHPKACRVDSRFRGNDDGLEKANRLM
jgi:hypothetical protein